MARRTWLAVLAAGLVVLTGAAPAQAVLRASGALERVSGGVLRLTVRNAGDEPFSVTRFTGRPGHGFLNPRASAGTCLPGTTELGPTLYCDATVAPGAALTVDFATEPPYPDGAGGRLSVQPSLDSTRAHVSEVTGPGEVPPAPVAGRSERVEPVSGVVRVRRRGTRRFVRLRAGRLLPDGSEIDATRGVVRVVVAASRTGDATASALVSEGRAVIRQNARATPTTTFRLSLRLACPRPSSADASARRRRKPRRRKLFVTTEAEGFRTRGGYAAATVRGTAWRTTDTCASTRIDVREGTVRVRDLVARRTVTVAAPGSYTARRARRSSPAAPASARTR